MNIQGIHQILPTIAFGDAVSNDALFIRKIIRDMGIKSEIYAEHIDQRLVREALNTKACMNNKDNIIIHHFSIGSDVNEMVFDMQCKKKIMIYHNITPKEFFLNYCPRSYALCEQGRKQLMRGIDKYDLCVGDSDYNAKELLNIGYKNVEVIPISFSHNGYLQKPNSSILQKYSDHKVNILFVGRVAPNKRHEDLLKVFFYFHNYINRNSRLLIVGSYNGMERYYNKLRSLSDDLNLDDVVFSGHVPFEDVLAYYRSSDVFLCLSQHEGFCVPLLEAMFFKLPIIAYNICAVPGTLRGAGVLVNRMDHYAISEIINEIVVNNDFRQRLIKKQSKVLTEYGESRIVIELKETLLKAIESAD